MSATTGGERLAAVLESHQVRFLFTLCGGHISPILVSAKERGVRVVDVRHEATALFAADAVARLTGVPGVVAVTAGPGVTNTITALKNAQLAQSPVIVLGGATATVLEGRGSLQDIDQMALVRPHVKWATRARRVRDLAPLLERAFDVAREGVPGPVFIECPVDLLYSEEVVRRWYGVKSESGGGVAARAQQLYLRWHLSRVFGDSGTPPARKSEEAGLEPSAGDLRRTAQLLRRARRPVLLVGSQAMCDVGGVDDLARAIEELEIPVFLSGMARGLLGRGHALQFRHQRKLALREADLVLLAGVPCDFRLDYGRQIGRRAKVISANRSRSELGMNRRPSLGAVCDSSLFLRRLATRSAGEVKADPDWGPLLRRRDEERSGEILSRAELETDLVNPLALCAALERRLPDDSALVADGGDFVATASYIVSPRGPLRWLDPGVFGTLGVGAGFALGAALCRPGSEVWILYGDGSAGYSLAEFDTFVRHRIPVIGLVGNDASWAQIARDQVEILGDDVGTVLRRTDYHRVAEGFGAVGLMVSDPAQIEATIAAAQSAASEGRPVLINALLEATDFRKGSISI